MRITARGLLLLGLGMAVWSGCIPSPCGSNEDCSSLAHCDLADGKCRMGAGGSTSSSSSGGGATSSSSSSGATSSATSGESSSMASGSSLAGSSSGGSSGNLSSSGNPSSSGGSSSGPVLAGTVEVYSPDETVVSGQALRLVMVVTNTGTRAFHLPTSVPTFRFNIGTVTASLPWSCPDSTCQVLGAQQSIRIDFTATVGDLGTGLGLNPTPLDISEVSFSVGVSPGSQDATLTATRTPSWRVRTAPVATPSMLFPPAGGARSSNCPTFCFTLTQEQNEPVDVVLKYSGADQVQHRATLANGSLTPGDAASPPAAGGTHKLRPSGSLTRCLAWNMPLDVGRPVPSGMYRMSVETSINGTVTGMGTSDSFTLAGTVLTQCGSDFAGVLLAEDGPQVDSAAVADVDGDGSYDLVSVTREAPEDKVLISRGVGAGAFQGRHSISNSTGLLGTSAVAVADLTGDGLKDIAVVDTSNKVRIFSQIDGPGLPQFGTPQGYSLPVGNGPIKLLAVDSQGDGYPDLFGFGEFTNGLHILSIVPPSAALPGMTHAPITVDGDLHIRDVATGDLNLDGLPEIVFLAGAPNAPWEIRVLWGGTLSGASVSTTVLTLGSAGILATDQPTHLTVGDFNHDGWPDLAVVSTYSQPPPGSLTAARVTLITQSPQVSVDAPGTAVFTVGTFADLDAGTPRGAFTVNVGGTDDVWTHLQPEGPGRAPFEIWRGPDHFGSVVAGTNLPGAVVALVDMDEGSARTPDIIGWFGPGQLGTVRVVPDSSASDGFRTESDTPLVMPQTSPLPTKLLSGRFTQAGKDELLTFWESSGGTSLGTATLWQGTTNVILSLNTSGQRARDAVAARVIESSFGLEQLVVATSGGLFTLAVDSAGMTTQFKDAGGNASAFTGMNNINRLHRGRFPTGTNDLDHLVMVGVDASSADVIKTLRSRPAMGSWVYEARNSTQVPFGSCTAVGYLGSIPSAFAQVPTVAGTASADIVRIFDLSQGSATPPPPSLTKTDLTSTMGRAVTQIVPVNTEVVFFDTASKQVRVVGDTMSSETMVLEVRGGSDRALLQAHNLNNDNNIELLTQLDGRLDVRVRSMASPTNYLVAAGLQVPGTVPLNPGVAPAVGDFNGDGALDVAVVFASPDNLQWAVHVTYGR